jgi:methionyl-tRNA formyltransferase
MRVVFMGTPEFSVPCLEALMAEADVEILGVVTQPDRPSGRGKKETPPPVKPIAEQAGIPVFQPERLRLDEPTQAWLEQVAPDFIVTIAFGQILPKRVLDVPRYGVVNVHASLLPAYRGANPIQWSVLNGDSHTGLTTMFSDEGVDTGDMLLTWETPVAPEETTGELASRMAQAAGPLLMDTLRGVCAGTITPQKQNDEGATLAPKLIKEAAWVNWNVSPEKVVNQIRGLTPWPGALTMLNETRLKLGRVSMLSAAELDVGTLDSLAQAPMPGTICGITPQGIVVRAAGEEQVLVQQVQPSSKPMMNASDWARNVVQPLLIQGQTCVFQSSTLTHV